MCKLVITNGWSDLNSGDSAIVMSVIQRFYMEYGDKLSVTVLSELNEVNEFYSDSIDKIIEVFPSISIKLIPSPFKKTYNDSYFDKMAEVVSFFKNLSLIPFSRSSKNDYIREIRSADVVVSKGGHFIHDRRGLHSVVHLIKCLYPIIIAKHLGVKYSLLAQSYGPFYQDTLLSKFNTSLVRSVLNNSEGLSVRESVSIGALELIGVDKNKTYSTSDYAFLMNDIDLKNCRKFDYNNFFVVTLRQHDFKDENGEQAYLESMKNLCINIYEKYSLSPLIVPHVKGPNSFENDIIITKKFESLLDEKQKDIFKFEYEHMHAIEFMQLYSKAKILIGTRFHSVIFALCSSVPSFAISYSGYKANIMKQFSMDDFMMNIDDVNHENLDVLEKRVFTLIDKNDFFREEIKNRMEHVRREIIEDPAFSNLKK
ncbi:polysaccharide pyruvyl transferase family protein [Vibrio sp. TMPB1044]|uniref:polysaccharide pyruvyl transferase family protein n=1 Tax=Vibrio sp. TMPB1044 TaxID=3051822 RepID=UPI00255C12F1|nr:polysaccharide pyruvyl transferase family protein [Vibrio sp. TMPB1044]MDL5026140.1 polysaccharide pyruvyl transferase family protein [Vibrio sp. TMPB1044]MDN5206268.1 polysaccharide pyruvyl transferase family protein [Vibrio sp. TMPB1044]